MSNSAIQSPDAAQDLVLCKLNERSTEMHWGLYPVITKIRNPDSSCLELECVKRNLEMTLRGHCDEFLTVSVQEMLKIVYDRLGVSVTTMQHKPRPAPSIDSLSSSGIVIDATPPPQSILPPPISVTEDHTPLVLPTREFIAPSSNRASSDEQDRFPAPQMTGTDNFKSMGSHNNDEPQVQKRKVVIRRVPPTSNVNVVKSNHDNEDMVKREPVAKHAKKTQPSPIPIKLGSKTLNQKNKAQLVALAESHYINSVTSDMTKKEIIRTLLSI